MATGTPNGENLLQGDFGESWLRAVAAGCGLLHGRPTTVDLEKADVELTQRGVVDGIYYPTVKVQVKTTTDLRITDDGRIAYDLDVATYEVLRRKDHSVRRVLVVIGLSDDGAWVRLVEGGTLLIGRGHGCPSKGHHRPATPRRLPCACRCATHSTATACTPC